MSKTTISGEKVRVKFDVSICKKTGEITVKMKDGLCKFKVGNSSLSEILNAITLGHMGADIKSISQKLNEFGKVNEDVLSSSLTSNAAAKVPIEEEEIEEKQKIKLGNV